MQDPIKILIVKPANNTSDVKPSTNFGLVARNTIINTASDLADLVHSPEVLMLRTKPQLTTDDTFRISVGKSPYALSAANLEAATRLHMIDVEPSKSFEGALITNEEGEKYREFAYKDRVPAMPTPEKLVTWLRRVLKVETKHFLVVSRSWSAMTKGVERYHAYILFDKPITTDEFVEGLNIKIQGEQRYQGLTAGGVYTNYHPWIDDGRTVTKLSFEYHRSNDFGRQVPVIREGESLSAARWVKPVRQPKLCSESAIQTFDEADYAWVVEHRNGRNVLGTQNLNDLSDSQLRNKYTKLLTESPVLLKDGTKVYDSFSDVPPDFKANITCPIEGTNDGRVQVSHRVVRFYGLGFSLAIPEKLRFLPAVESKKYIDIEPHLNIIQHHLSFLKAPPGKGKTRQSLRHIPHGMLTQYPKGIIYLVPVYTLLHDLKKDYPEVNIMVSKDEAKRLEIDHKKWEDSYIEGGVNIMTFDKFMGENGNGYIDMSGLLVVMDEVHSVLQSSETDLQKVMSSNKLYKNRWYRQFMKDVEILNTSVLMLSATAMPEWFMLDNLQIIAITFPIDTKAYASRVPAYDKIYGELSSLTIKQDKPSINFQAQQREAVGRLTQLSYSKHTEHVETNDPIDIFTTSSGLAGVSYTQPFNGCLIYNDTPHNFGAIGLCQAVLRIRNHANNPHLCIKIANTHFREEHNEPQPISWLYNLARYRSVGMFKYMLEVNNFLGIDTLMQKVAYIDDGELIIDEAAVIAYYIASLEAAQRNSFELMAEYMANFGVELVDDFSHHDELSSAKLKVLNDKGLASVGLSKVDENYKAFSTLMKSLSSFDDLSYYLEVEDTIELGEEVIQVGKAEKMLQSTLSHKKADLELIKDSKKYELTEAAQVRTITDASFKQVFRRHQTAHALGFYKAVDPFFTEGRVYNRQVIVNKMNAALPELKPHTFDEDSVLERLDKFCIYEYDRDSGVVVIIRMRLLDDDDILVPVNNYMEPSLTINVKS